MPLSFVCFTAAAAAATAAATPTAAAAIPDALFALAPLLRRCPHQSSSVGARCTLLESGVRCTSPEENHLDSRPEVRQLGDDSIVVPVKWQSLHA